MTDKTVTDISPNVHKAALRKKALAQRAEMSAGARAGAAKKATSHFLENVKLTPQQVVAAYWPIRDEIDSKPLLISLMEQQQTVCLPVVMGDAVPLQFRHWREGEPLYPGGFGTLVPDELASVLQPDLVIIPLLGFDKAGTRLGFGKGYYDRTIAVMDKRPTLVGYAFAAQELDSIPREPHDVPLDYLVTEAGVRQFIH